MSSADEATPPDEVVAATDSSALAAEEVDDRLSSDDDASFQAVLKLLHDEAPARAPEESVLRASGCGGGADSDGTEVWLAFPWTDAARA